MFIGVKSNAVRFNGRWKIDENCAVTTAPGSSFELAFGGRMAVMHFDMETNRHPYGHLWVSVDGGADIEVPMERYLRIKAADSGNHVARIIYKSSVEIHHRWYQPLEGKVSFKGFDADSEGTLPEDNRKTIEFIGDSITEGVLIDAFYNPESFEQWNRPWQDDSTATYAYLTAEKLGLRPIIMGYGAVGITKSGCGSVPKAEEAYPYYFDGAPMESANADYIVINHGANDSRADALQYTEGYKSLLKLVRSRNEKSKIIVLSAFCGVHAKELAAAVADYNRENTDNVYFIDSTGWVPAQPLHPLRDGHMIISEKLTQILKDICV
ncbi:MAG: hypothetical protein J6N52_03370 [Clostridia bacterium]|nr:hypothetical protein [Clostridia bacterium]